MRSEGIALRGFKDTNLSKKDESVKVREYIYRSPVSKH